MSFIILIPTLIPPILICLSKRRQKKDFHINMKSSTAVFMLLSSRPMLLSARVCSYRRGRCVCGLGVCVTPTPPLQVWVHCKYYFFYTLVHSDSFSPSRPHCCHLFPLGLLKLRDITRTLTASPEKEVKSFSRSLFHDTALSPQLTHTTGGSYGADAYYTRE